MNRVIRAATPAAHILLLWRLAVLSRLQSVDDTQREQLQRARESLQQKLDPTTGEVILAVWPVFIVAAAALAALVLLALFGTLAGTALVILAGIVAVIVRPTCPEATLLVCLLEAVELTDQLRLTRVRPSTRRELVLLLERIALVLGTELPRARDPGDLDATRAVRGELHRLAGAFRNLKLGVALPNPEGAGRVMEMLIVALQAEAAEDWRLMPGASSQGIANPA